MTSAILIVAFVLCAGAAAGAVLVGRQLVRTYTEGFHRQYFYYLVAFYAFALYGLWGQILGRTFLASLGTSIDVIETVIGFLSVLGVPFLFVSWLMLISMGHSMAGATPRQAWMAVHAFVFVLLLLVCWTVLAIVQPAAGLRAALLVTTIGLELAYVAGFVTLVVRSRNAGTSRGSERALRFAMLMAGAFVLRSAALPLLLLEPAWAAPAAVVYFGSNLVPLLYLRSVADQVFEPISAAADGSKSMEHLFERYGITKREREIVRQICLGKTNQQIADELFISLQTVKDHTHRIYSKVGVRSRIQLVQKVNA